MESSTHYADRILADVHHSSDGRGWLTLKVKRVHPEKYNRLEDVEVTLFTEDIARLADSLDASLTEAHARMGEGRWR